MGDKTQLATISLAVEYRNMLNVLMGTTLGMVIADTVGIVVGIVLCKRIPERIIKWISAGVFVLFGFAGVHRILSGRIGEIYTLLVLCAMGLCTVWAAVALSRRSKRSIIGRTCK